MEIFKEHKKLKMNEEVEFNSADNETAIVIISGKYMIQFEEHEFDTFGERNSVFDSIGHVIYVPCKYHARLTSKSEELDVVIISTHADNKLKPLVKKGGFHKERRGNDEYVREVIDFLSADNGETHSLFVGETIHTEGVWSGFPPHKHDSDLDGIESMNEEIYFIKIQPDYGFGVFISYTDDNDMNAEIVHNEDFIYVKKGYHSVISEPKQDFYYLWAASSKGKKFLSSVDERYINNK